MNRYVSHRLLLAIPTLLGLTILVFFFMRVAMPVDAVDLSSALTGTPDPAREAAMREAFHLTGPLPMQYVGWLGRLFTGDWGTSFYNGRSVASELMARTPVSFEIGFGALIITMIFGIPIGLLSAARQDSAVDYATRGVAIAFYAIPGFWVATMILVFGGAWFSWAPPVQYHQLWEDPIANLQQVLLPLVLLGLAPIGSTIRLVRSQVLEVIRQDYVRTARAKGLGWRAVYFRHILRNSLIPIVTVIGLRLPTLIAGTVIFEQIFVLPGMGRYLLEALQRLDLYVIMGTNLFFGIILVSSNLIVDICYVFIDPRIRLS